MFFSYFIFFQAHLAGYKELVKDLEPDPDSEFDPEMARNVIRECYGGTFQLVGVLSSTKLLAIE